MSKWYIKSNLSITWTKLIKSGKTCDVKFHKGKTKTTTKKYLSPGIDRYDLSTDYGEDRYEYKDENYRLDTIQGRIMDSKNRWWNVNGYEILDDGGTYNTIQQFVDIELDGNKFKIEAPYESGWIGHYKDIFSIFVNNKNQILDDILREIVSEYRVKENEEIYELWKNGGNYQNKKEQEEQRKKDRLATYQKVQNKYYIKDGNIVNEEELYNLSFNDKIIKIINNGDIYVPYDLAYKNEKFYEKDYQKERYNKIDINDCSAYFHLYEHKDIFGEDISANFRNNQEKFFIRLKENIQENMNQKLQNYYNTINKLSERFNYKAAKDDKFLAIYYYVSQNRDKFPNLYTKMQQDFSNRNDLKTIKLAFDAVGI